ncbi:MAG: family 78 glycoside hydrolase catalytic domain [Kiritimatiellae bacterium]|nr:family 78 glycoside hydrolase catalytic domain [Kiritimatiellia bacterium]MDD5522049.1 family 78 glycoside hydrolase catalytic domain [Kiritimatiellia bacterium]
MLKEKLPSLVFTILLAGSVISANAGLFSSTSVPPQRLRCEYLENPLGIDVEKPRLSWIIDDCRLPNADLKSEIINLKSKMPRDIRQTAYQILVASSLDLLAKNSGDLWDSGKVESDKTSQIEYAGKLLQSRQQCYWKIKVWTSSIQNPKSRASEWSNSASWEMGLLKAKDWKARWIEAVCSKTADNDSLVDAKWIWHPEPGVNLRKTAPTGERFFRRHVTVPSGSKPKSATLIITVDDQYTLFINGKEAGKMEEKDGWRRPKRYDVTSMLVEGDNILALATKNIENAAGVCAKLILQFPDKEQITIVSDKQWKAGNQTVNGWNSAGFDDKAWKNAAEIVPVGKGVWGEIELASASSAVPILRKTVKLADKPIARARLYATALGLYQMNINGQRVGDILFAPEWTDYHKRIRYQTYDVTSMLKKGDNVLAGLIGHGWYSGHIGNGNYRHYGKIPALFAQLEVTYADDTVERVVTDDTWKINASPILASDFMLGENYDARRKINGWDEPGLDDSSWKNAMVREETPVPFESQVMEPVRRICEIKPRTITEPKPGCWTFDLGQNMVGYLRLKVSAPAGTKLTIRHAEMLNPDGTIYTINLRAATSIDTYTCKGAGVEIYQPYFTFHGFRYVEITGLPGKPTLDTITGVVVASDAPRTSEFACSDSRINQLYSNIIWGQRGNYLSIPTDCPQRDERLGWMGDAQVFVRTATYNADVAAFFTKWLVDVDDAQTPDGAFTDVSPRAGSGHGTPAWADAGVICPWTIYHVYGDARLLEKHYPSMVKWIEWCRTHSKDLIREEKKDRGGDYGDWLSIGADTPKDLIGTAYFAYSTRLVAKAAKALGKTDDAAKYEQLFQNIKAAFNKKYVAVDGRIKGNTQCCYIMALKFDLLSDDMRTKAVQYLIEDITGKNDHLSTGFVGVSYLLPVLTQAGKLDTVFKLFLQDTFPSWLFSVKHGATTIWERWDGWTPEKGFQDPGMNSFNHYSLGSCGEWMFSTLAGIDTDGPGFKKLVIRPTPGNGITWAKASYDSINGKIATSWKTNGNTFSLDVVIPPNTTAAVHVPVKDAGAVKESGVSAAKSKGVQFLRMDNGAAVYAVGSGSYSFTAN